MTSSLAIPSHAALGIITVDCAEVRADSSYHCWPFWRYHESLTRRTAGQLRTKETTDLGHWKESNMKSCTDHDDRFSVVGTCCGCLALAVDASFTSSSSRPSLRHFTQLLAPRCTDFSASGMLRSHGCLVGLWAAPYCMLDRLFRAEGRFGWVWFAMIHISIQAAMLMSTRGEPSSSCLGRWLAYASTSALLKNSSQGCPVPNHESEPWAEVFVLCSRL